MLRGVNKQIIEVNNTGNRYFERALLFVKPEYSDAGQERLEREADRLLAAMGPPPAGKRTQARIVQRRRTADRRRFKVMAGTVLLFAAGLIVYFILRQFV